MVLMLFFKTHCYIILLHKSNKKYFDGELIWPGKVANMLVFPYCKKKNVVQNVR